MDAEDGWMGGWMGGRMTNTNKWTDR